MSESPDDKGLRHSLELFKDNRLSSNSQFSFLYEKLNEFYSESIFSKVGSKKKSYKLLKEVNRNLHLLMSEVLMTKDPARQDQLVGYVYDWYIENANLNKCKLSSIWSKDECSSGLIKEKIFEKTETSLPLIRARYIPKQKIVTREQLLRTMNEKYTDLLNSEQISLNLSKKRLNITPIPERSLNEPRKSKLIETNFNKTISKCNKSEELKSPQHYDFRSISHKYRMASQNKHESKLKIKFPLKTTGQIEAELVKSRLATKHQPVSTKTLENALVTHHMLSCEDPLLNFPKGGEFLLKSFNFS